MKRILRKFTATLLVLALCICMIPGIPLVAHGATYRTTNNSVSVGYDISSEDYFFVCDGVATYTINSEVVAYTPSGNAFTNYAWTATINASGQITFTSNGASINDTQTLSNGNNAWRLYWDSHASGGGMVAGACRWGQTYVAPPAVDPTINAPTLASELTYDSTAQQLITAAAASNSSGEISYGLGASDSAAPSNWYTGITNSNLKGTDAGTYYIWYKQAAATGYNAKAATYVGSVTIDRAANPLTYTSAQTLNKNFNSLEQTATLTAAENGEGAVTYAILNQKDSSNNAVTYFSLGGSSNTLVIAAGTPVGTYTVNVRATAAGNGNYESGTTDSAVTVNIGRAAPTVTAPTANTLTYNGTEQQLITAGSTNGGTLQYSLNGTDYVEDPTTLTATAAGIYTVYYKVTGDANYGDVAADTVSVTIAKKDITISGITAGDKTYDGDPAATLNLENVVFGGILGNDSLTVTAIGAFADAAAGAGKTVNITGLTLGGVDIANYKLAASGQQTTATATIAKLAITIKANDQTVALNEAIASGTSKVTVTAGTLVTGHEISSITLTGSGTSAITQNGTITPSDAVIMDSGSNDVTGNYEITLETGVLTVTQAAPIVNDAPSASNITYGQALVNSAITGSMKDKSTSAVVDGTFSWDDSTVKPIVSDSDTTAYGWTFTPTDTANYGSAHGTLTLTVNPKEATLHWENTEFTYDGQSHAPTATVTNLETGDSCSVTVSGDQTDYSAVAYTATASGLSNANYALPADPTTDFTIAKRPITIKANDQTVALDGSITNSTDKISVTAGTLVDGHSITGITLTDSGTSVVTENGVITPSAVTIKDGSSNTVTGNYEVSYESGVLTVTKAAPTFTAPTANTLTYDGTVQELANAGTATGGTVWYRLGETGTWAESVPGAKSAATYTIYYYIKGDANHSDLGSESAPKGSIEATIAQKEAVLGWANTAFAYNGSAHIPTATVENLESGDSCTVTVTGGAIEVGSHTATATQLSNSNYKLPSGVTQVFTIAGAKVVNNDGSAVTAPKRGDTLKAVLEPTDNGDSYQWYRGNTAIDGATAKTYQLTNDDVGKNIKVIVTKDTTTYTSASEGPVAQVHDIEVAISSEIDTNVTLKLKQGTVQIGSSQTVTLTGSGPYTGTGTFNDVSDGVYNIVATQGIKTVTAAVTISGTAATAQVTATIPSDDVNSILDVQSGAPAVVAAGLDREAQDNKEDGQNVTIEMTVENEAAGTAEATAIKAQSDQTNTNGKGAPTMTYMDVSVTKTVGASAPEAVHETQDIIELIIPFNVTGRTIWMWRNHQDTVQKLTNNTTHGEGTFWTDAVNNLIHLYAKKYSVYAIGYVEGTVNTGGGSGGSGGGGGGGGATGVVPTPSTTPATVETPAIEVVPAPESIRWCLKDATCPIDKFPDAYTWEWYHDGVHWALSELVMKGFDDGFFYPGSSTTRAQVATMLWRLAGCPVVDYQMTFADVPSYEWFVEQVRWAAANGIITGFMYGGYDVFDPNGPITREQLAAMIYRFAKLNGIATADAKAFKLNFTDAGNLSDYASDAMKWMVSQGIITGTADENGAVTLDPQGNASRAQIATMFMRYCTKFIQH